MKPKTDAAAAPQPAASLLGAVLAGGRSQRMGTDKARLGAASGQTFLEHALQVLSSVCARVVVAGRSGDAAASDAPMCDAKGIRNVRWLSDDEPARGPIAGLVTAMRFAATEPGIEAVLIIPVDMPSLRREHLLALIERFEQDSRQPVAATFDASHVDNPRAEPLLAIYPLDCLNSLTQLSQAEDRSLSRWLNRHSPALIRLSKQPLCNINTPDELDAWRRNAPPRDT